MKAAAAVQQCRRDQLFCSSADGFITATISVWFMEKVKEKLPIFRACILCKRQFLIRDKRTKKHRHSLDMPQTSYLIKWTVGYFGYIISESDQVGQPFRARYLDHQLLLYKILRFFFKDTGILICFINQCHDSPRKTFNLLIFHFSYVRDQRAYFLV